MSVSPSATPAPHLVGRQPIYDATVWIRLPRPGERCPVSGLSRTSLVELIVPCERNGYRAPVAARHLKRKGARRGVMLIQKQSLLDYLNEQPAPEAPKTGNATEVEAED